MVNFAISRLDGGRGPEAVLLRFRGTGHCTPELERRIAGLGARTDAQPAKAMLQSQDAPVRRPRFLVSGWACRYRHLSDGRRQIFDLVLPGEGVGVCLRAHPLANTNTAAITAVRLVDASPLLSPGALEECPELRAALQAQGDADERRALNQIVRLGRLTALERLAHLMLELRERMAAIGQADGDRFALPLTQETLADMTGLSVVHVNRTLQELRRQNLLQLERGIARLLDREGLEQLADYEPAQRSPDEFH